jgi:hypothetical protein
MRHRDRAAHRRRRGGIGGGCRLEKCVLRRAIMRCVLLSLLNGNGSLAAPQAHVVAGSRLRGGYCIQDGQWRQTPPGFWGR